MSTSTTDPDAVIPVSDTRFTSDKMRTLQEDVRRAKQALTDHQKSIEPHPVQDFTLTNPDGTAVKLSELFGDASELLVAHNMGRGCNYCTLWGDGFIGFTRHLETRCPFVLCSNDPPPVLDDVIEERGWNFRCVSGIGPEDPSGKTANSGFAAAMGFMSPEGKPWPGISAFAKTTDGGIVRTGCSPFGPGDDYCAVWAMFDLLRDGVGGFEPK